MSTTEPTDEMVEALSHALRESMAAEMFTSLRVMGATPESWAKKLLSMGEPMLQIKSVAAQFASASSPSAPTEDDREALGRAIFAEHNPEFLWPKLMEVDRERYRQKGDARRSPVAPSEDVTKLLSKFEDWEPGHCDCGNPDVDPDDIRALIAALRSGAAVPVESCTSPKGASKGAVETVSRVEELPVGSVFWGYYYPPAFTRALGAEPELARLQLTRGRSIVHGERFECSILQEWERIEVLFRPDREEQQHG